MRIIRSPRQERDFTTFSNALLRDQTLSFRARGILTYLLSMRDGWETSAEKISTAGSEGRDAVRTALKELERAGYLRRWRTQSAVTGLWVTGMAVFDDPENSLQYETVDFQSSDIRRSDSQSSQEVPVKKNLEEKNSSSPATPALSYDIEDMDVDDILEAIERQAQTDGIDIGFDHNSEQMAIAMFQRNEPWAFIFNSIRKADRTQRAERRGQVAIPTAHDIHTATGVAR